MRPALAILVLLLAACSSAPARSSDPPAPPSKDPVDYTCKTDADCEVKDVGNCCGYYPACVNRESPTFPDRVKAECVKKGMMGVCGFPEIKGCTCVEGKCAARPEDGSTIR